MVAVKDFVTEYYFVGDTWPMQAVDDYQKEVFSKKPFAFGLYSWLA